MRPIYWVWAAGLLLKGIGATWDVAWHFRILREAISPPHMVNTLGGVLCAAALLYEWRHRDERRTGPLLVVVAGLGMFLLAMPIDQWWHMTFGLDLTTWSPAHMMLFGGTMIAVFGVLLLYVTDLTKGEPDVQRAIARSSVKERVMLGFLVVFFAGAVYFPMTYNEYTTVAAEIIRTDPGSMDPALVEQAKLYDDPVFANTPLWLYPVYGVAIAAFIGTVCRAWLGRGWALVALGGIALERVVANGILDVTGWPTAALPLQFAGIGIAIELVWLAPTTPLVLTVASSVAGAAVGYAYYANPLTWTAAVPLTADSWPAGVLAAVVSGLLGLLLVRRGLRYVAEVPRFELTDVKDWAAGLVSRR